MKAGAAIFITDEVDLTTLSDKMVISQEPKIITICIDLLKVL